jgi:hypothetical protein
MIRHPAAFCSSLRILNLNFDFRVFLEQPLLMERILSRFAGDIERQASLPVDIISQGILLWNCFHHTIEDYRRRHPGWLFVRHEDLSAAPIPEFRSIYQSLNLEFSRHAQSAIQSSSGPHNPTEQQPGKMFIRNSRESITNWKRRLTPLECEAIRTGTAEIAQLFYSEKDW